MRHTERRWNTITTSTSSAYVDNPTPIGTEWEGLIKPGDDTVTGTFDAAVAQNGILTRQPAPGTTAVLSMSPRWKLTRRLGLADKHSTCAGAGQPGSLGLALPGDKHRSLKSPRPRKRREPALLRPDRAWLRDVGYITAITSTSRNKRPAYLDQLPRQAGNDHVCACGLASIPATR